MDMPFLGLLLPAKSILWEMRFNFLERTFSKPCNPLFWGESKSRMEVDRGKEVSRLKGSGSPYNNRIELIARGRHAARLRERRASSPPAAGLPPSACGPCSQFIRALYGRG